jgi:hypothetical protein
MHFPLRLYRNRVKQGCRRDFGSFSAVLAFSPKRNVEDVLTSQVTLPFSRSLVCGISFFIPLGEWPSLNVLQRNSYSLL